MRNECPIVPNMLDNKENKKLSIINSNSDNNESPLVNKNTPVNVKKPELSTSLNAN